MNRYLCVLLLSLLLPLAAMAIDPQQFDSPEQEARYHALIEELRCMVCQNQNLADSNATLAQDLRDEVLRLIRDGLDDEQIKAYLTERYGDFVLYRPPVKPATYALWFGPIVLVLIAGGVVFMVVRKRSRDEVPLMPDPDQEELDRRLENSQ